ncbi:hypothetical protein V8C86DRAFT_2877242, partial [Haematococcus lacustris]
MCAWFNPLVLAFSTTSPPPPHPPPPGMLVTALGWAGLGWAGLGWAGLGWAGLGSYASVLAGPSYAIGAAQAQAYCRSWRCPSASWL